MTTAESIEQLRATILREAPVAGASVAVRREILLALLDCAEACDRDAYDREQALASLDAALLEQLHATQHEQRSSGDDS